MVGAAVHGFNRWQWAEADFVVDGVAVRAPVDALAVRHGDGAGGVKSGRYHVIDRRSVSYPPTRNNNAMVGYNTAAGTLAELVVDAGSGRVTLLTHHTIVDCGNVLVPDLISSQIQGDTATGIGLALHEQMPLLRGWSRQRHLEPKPLSPAARQRRGGVGADR